MKMKDAVRLALLNAQRKGRLTAGVWGQDNAGTGPKSKGGVLAETQGLPFAHNSILNERSAAWIPYGAAFMKQPAVGIMQFADYQHNTYDILKIIGETCWSSGGRVPMPLVIMCAYGALNGKGAMYHSQTVENEMVGLPGWKVVSASNSYDAAVLLNAAIRDPNPVHFMYPRAHSGFPTDSATQKGQAHLELPGFQLLPGEKELLETPSDFARNAWTELTAPPSDQRDGSWVQEWPKGLEIPEEELGRARCLREGDDAVIFTHGRMVPMAWHAAEALSYISGREIAVVDLRSLKPAPLEDMKAFVQTSRGRILFLNEATARNNWMKTLAQDIQAEMGWQFETYPQVLCALDSPVGQALAIEKQILPQSEDVFAALCEFFPRTLIQEAAQRLNLELDPDGEWFEKRSLAEFSQRAHSHAKAQSPKYSETQDPIQMRERSK